MLLTWGKAQVEEQEGRRPSGVDFKETGKS